MKRIVLSLTALFLIALVACQKEFTIEEDPTIPGNTDSAVLLKKYIRLDTTLTAPNDTIFTATYSYDNLNRCTSILYKYTDHPYATEEEGTATETISYNGTDTLISRRFMRVDNADGTTFTTSAYFTYALSGLLIKDSLNYDMTRTVFSHRYDGNIVHSISKFSGSPVDTFFYSRHHLQKLNGNIIAEKDTAFDASNGWPYSQFTITAVTAQYDTHPNPLFKVSSPWPVLFEAEHFFQDDFTSQQRNNCLFNSTFFGDTEEYTYQYTYLPNGYPSVARIRYNNTNTSVQEYWKAIYQY